MPKINGEARPRNESFAVRVLTGLHFYRLTDEAAKTFFEDTWTVAPEADRIGYRYRKGRPLSFRERKQPFGAGSLIHPTLSTPAIPTVRSRYRAGSSQSFSIATPYRGRLRRDRHGDQCGHGSYWADAAEQPCALRRGRHGRSSYGARGI
jgi:hypothetical protein